MISKYPVLFGDATLLLAELVGLPQSRENFAPGLMVSQHRVKRGFGLSNLHCYGLCKGVESKQMQPVAIVIDGR